MKLNNKYIIFALIFLIGIILSSYKIYSIRSEYKLDKKAYDTLKRFVELPTDTINIADSPGETLTVYESRYTENSALEESSADETERILYPIVNFEALGKINSDIVGWIYIDNTSINYPIVQGNDNSYYLKHLFDKNYSNSGCIFLDCNNCFDFSDQNSVVFGHHMKSGTMFSSLTKYKNQEFYNAHPQAILVTPNENYVIAIFSGYVASTKDNAWEISFDSDDDFMEWLSHIQTRSCFKSIVTPLSSDRIITFSTCSYEFNDARFILHGIIRCTDQ